MTGPIGILGGGAWGTALAVAAAGGGAGTGRDVVLWMRNAQAARDADRTRAAGPRLPGATLPPSVRVTAVREDLGGCRAVLLAVPAQAIRSALSEAGPPGPRVPLVVCAKGIEAATGSFLSDVVSAARPEAPVAILSGPGFAADVARGLPTAVSLASRDGALAQDLAAALSGPALRVYHGTDVRGVEIGGAGKNVLAIAVGIVDGRGLGESAKAALTARGFAELLRFASACGARPETLMGLSGLGDVVLSCASAQSRNFALGLRLGRGGRHDPAGSLAEGAWTASALSRLARACGVEMPVAEAVDAVLAGRMSVGVAVDALMARPLRSEA